VDLVWCTEQSMHDLALWSTKNSMLENLLIGMQKLSCVVAKRVSPLNILQYQLQIYRKFNVTFV